ncbi:MAG: hypothetical protein KAY06_00195 [Aeromonadaceae bacterium]|nr:hypothetical protein [Aeromonadaceae bacterium]
MTRRASGQLIRSSNVRGKVTATQPFLADGLTDGTPAWVSRPAEGESENI